jgi:hypothetical protein
MKKTAEILKNSTFLKSIMPLTFWYKDEHAPLGYFIESRGTSFLYRTNTNYYLITARHNFCENDKELNRNFIMSKLNKLVITKHSFNSDNGGVCRNDLKFDNLLKFSYIESNICNEEDICILRIRENAPEDKYFFTEGKLNFEIEDNGFMVGFPKNGNEYNDRTGVMYVTPTILNVGEPSFMMGENVNYSIYQYNKEQFTVENFSGFSGSPIMHYNPTEDNFFIFGMCITAGKGIFRAIPMFIISDVIKKFEENNNYSHS